MIQNRVFDEIEIGDSASVSHVLTTQDIQLFALMTGDVNPAHVDEEYASNEIFRGIVAHGIWTASLVSTVLGTRLPGPGTIYLEQTLSFRRPVHVGDCVTATVTVLEKDAENRTVSLECLCRNQDGKEVVTGKAKVLAPEEKVSRPRAQLPKVQLKEDRNTYYEQLLALKGDLEPIKTAIVHPVDASSLGGAIGAAEEGLIEPILIGPENKIRSVAEENGIDLRDFRIVSTPHSHGSAIKATAMAAEGEVEALMKGKIHTQEMLEPVVQRTTGLRTGRRMSHVFVLDVPTYHKPLFLTDAAVNVRPTLLQKIDIVQNAIDLFLTLGIGVPKVAVVSAVEVIDENLPSTLDAAALCKMADRGQITGGVLDGPLGFDNAVSSDAARAKGIFSRVAGDADIIVVPDVESGNMLYKQMRYLSGIEAAGIVLGAKVPIILTSRAAGEGLTRKTSCALAMLYTRKRQVVES